MSILSLQVYWKPDNSVEGLTKGTEVIVDGI